MQANQHLAAPRLAEIEFLDDQRGGELLEDGGADPHAGSVADRQPRAAGSRQKRFRIGSLEGASPTAQLLAALDALDVEAVMALAAPDIEYLFADGRRGEGADAMREAMTGFLGSLRSTSHRVTNELHVDDTWICEVTGDYELRDHLQLKALPRALIVRMGANGIASVHAYGAHEHPLVEHRTGGEGMIVGGRWIPSL
jgi:hypothetical protein